MAIITGTALAGATITSGVIASGAAFAASAAGTAISLSQAKKQKEAQKEAQEAASVALDSARKKLEINYQKGRSIVKEPYELEREAGLSGLKQIVQAGQEGDPRGAVATAGRAALFNQGQQVKSRLAMSKELAGLQDRAASEEARLQRLRVGLDAEEARSETARAQQLGIEAANSQNNVLKGIAGMVKVSGQEIPEYLKTNASLAKNIEVGDPADEMSFNQAFGFTPQAVLPFDPNFDPNSVPYFEEDIIFNNNN